MLNSKKPNVPNWVIKLWQNDQALKAYPYFSFGLVDLKVSRKNLYNVPQRTLNRGKTNMQ